MIYIFFFIHLQLYILLFISLFYYILRFYLIFLFYDSLFRNGKCLGEAFNSVRTGPGYAYFPAVSLSMSENVRANFGATPLRYPFFFFSLEINNSHKFIHLFSISEVFGSQINECAIFYMKIIGFHIVKKNHQPKP